MFVFEDEKSRRFRSQENLIILILQGIIVYTLFYMVCLAGKLGKTEMLGSNLKVTGITICFLLAFQNLMQGLFLENVIDKFLNTRFYDDHTNFYTITSTNSLCTILAFFSIYQGIVKEMRELRAIYGVQNQP
jgi:hypothetical protein